WSDQTPRSRGRSATRDSGANGAVDHVFLWPIEIGQLEVQLLRPTRGAVARGASGAPPSRNTGLTRTLAGLVVRCASRSRSIAPERWRSEHRPRHDEPRRGPGAPGATVVAAVVRCERPFGEPE